MEAFISDFTVLGPLHDIVLTLLILLSFLAVFACRSSSKQRPFFRSNSRGLSSHSEKTKIKEREWGEWPAVSFSHPPTIPGPSPMELKPIPYRPFRWGAYHVTMGIRDMPWDEWIELDNQMQSHYHIKKHRIATRGTNVIQILPDRPGIVKSARQSAIELVHELSEYLGKRYPDAFTVTRASSGNILNIKIVPLRAVDGEEAEEAMKISALLVQDDLALMVEGTDGRYYFQGGAICVAGFWRMRDKIGLPLEDIHIRGQVPQYETKLRHSMDRFFKRMSVEKPIIRNNYFFQVIPPKEMRIPLDTITQSSADPIIENNSIVDPEELAWSETTNGNEETFVHGHPITPDKQPVVALRRLPLSGAILFTIRTYLFPVEGLAKEPGIPARMASALRSWPEDVREYKGNGLYEKVMLEYLDRAAEKQRMEGGEDYVKEPGYPF
ncbi:hypothetical protein D9757_000378 [Collybiopsis confluens]|uniref:Uncharacterized protein n=1 Tax=Collybiopsis confluens TaxID=2823264 RepID=A0A8H5I2E1_9AGAR|nr:hypothetical protein D9757_000378 [Collybiopsis confluens]